MYASIHGLQWIVDVVVVAVVVAHLWQRNGKLKVTAMKCASLALEKRIGKAEKPRQMGSW